MVGAAAKAAEMGYFYAPARGNMAEGQKMSHVPEGWGVEITFLFIRAHPVSILPSFKV